MSDNSGIDKLPKPPSFRGVFTQAKWVKCESTDAATTSASILLNSSMRSLKANISVGQTNVLQTNIPITTHGRRRAKVIHLQVQWVKEEH